MFSQETKNTPEKEERPALKPGVIGALVGFIFALLWVIFGFWKLLFILVLALLGYYVGYRFFSDRNAIKKFIDKLFPPGMFR